MKKIHNALFAACLPLLAAAQTNILSTNPTAHQVMLGSYDPADYEPSVAVSLPDDIVAGILADVSADSLKAYLLRMQAFHNRNSGSDTLSADKGIGAARRWVFQKFQQFSQENEGRLLPSYLQFDRAICGAGQHRNVFAVLPGLDTSAHGLVLVEAHLDSRCATSCDTACLAEGMEDNGSGTALLLELARVMSRYALDRTVVFMATTAEEQGLYGADAFAKFAKNEGIAIAAVLNNDVVGGILCGETSSPPSCPGLNHVDSTQVRLFSSGTFNSPHKQLARFNKLQYQEELKDLVAVPMLLTVMSGEDREGRGGDHIPFRQQGFPSMRFTSANEHGNADAANPNYHDRQHTSGDVLGEDTDGDGALDSFFVDFNYLARNAVINGVAAGMAAQGVRTPAFTAGKIGDSLQVDIAAPAGYGLYRIFLRSASNDFDTIFTVSQTSVRLLKPVQLIFYVSVAAVDGNGIESLFTGEVLPGTLNAAGEQPSPVGKNIELLQNRPNPFDEATTISFWVNQPVAHREAWVSVTDGSGREVKRLPVAVAQGMNEVLYRHGYNASGVFGYSLVVDGKVVDSKRMVFAN